MNIGSIAYPKHEIQYIWTLEPKLCHRGHRDHKIKRLNPFTSRIEGHDHRHAQNRNITQIAEGIKAEWVSKSGFKARCH